jgi:hypothetical protein
MNYRSPSWDSTTETLLRVHPELMKRQSVPAGQESIVEAGARKPRFTLVIFPMIDEMRMLSGGRISCGLGRGFPSLAPILAHVATAKIAQTCCRAKILMLHDHLKQNTSRCLCGRTGVLDGNAAGYIDGKHLQTTLIRRSIAFPRDIL